MVTRDQLLNAGLNADAIAYRLKVGRLHRVHRGVYAVGHLPPSPHARAMAAVLACGLGAVLSHRSAAALWRITPPWQGAVDVTARGKHAHAGIKAHRSARLNAAGHHPPLRHPRHDTAAHARGPETDPPQPL